MDFFIFSIQRNVIEDMNRQLEAIWNTKENKEAFLDVISLINESQHVEDSLKRACELQMAIQQLHHRQCFIGDLDRYYEVLVSKCQPEKSIGPELVTQILKDVCRKLASNFPEFKCHLLGTGSYHDHTKIGTLDEMDFIMKLQYNSYRDYKLRITKDKFCEIICSESSYFQKYLSLYGGILNIIEFRSCFKSALSAAIQESCEENKTGFGGYNRPHFSGFRENGPAMTITIADISVDLTLVLEAPKHFMWKILNEKADPDVLRYMRKHLPGYTKMGLIVLLPNVCEVSTSWMETNLLKRNSVIRKTLIICKYYKESLLNVEWPCLKMFYEHIIQHAEKFDLQEMNTKYLYKMMSDDSPEVLILHEATRVRPVTEELSSLQTKLRQLIGNMGSLALHPSLAEIVNEQAKSLIGTTSFIFKTLILKEFCRKPILSTSECVLLVLTRYQQQLVVGKKPKIIHALLGKSLPILKIYQLDDELNVMGALVDIHKRHVVDIVQELHAFTNRSRVCIAYEQQKQCIGNIFLELLCEH